MDIVTPQDFENGARKRQRRSPRPCDACRTRKSRCLMKRGESDCVHCQLRGTKCTFELNPPERPAPASAQKNGNHGNEMSERRGSVVELGSGGEGGHRASQTSPAETRVSAASVALGPSNLAAAPAPLKDGSSGTLGLDNCRFAELYGLGSDMEPILMVHRPYRPDTQEFSLETHAIRRVLENDDGQEYPLTFHVASDDKAVDGDPTYVQVDAVEECVKPHGPGLVDLFWKHVQPCYPILAKEIFIQRYAGSYRHIPASLLAAVYLSAIRWWTYDPELSIKPSPDAGVLRKILKSAIPSSYHRPKMSSIQAALLLLQCQPEDPLNPDHTYQWGLTCQALAIGQCLGLHLDASDWAVPQWERNLRKRLSWALYMQDRWTALAYGRPVHIHEDDWTVQPLTSMDFTDYDTTRSNGLDEERKSISATGKMQFIEMARLTEILSGVISNFYTAKGSRGQDTVLLYSNARRLLDALQGWYQTIPPPLQMNIVYQRKLCFHGYLHFSYFGVMMTLLRRLIRSTALPPRCADDRVLSDIRQIALETAQAAISFVTALRPDQLEAFWYFTSPYLFSLLGSFTTLLLVTSLSSQERAFWQETLNSYLWTLRMMSKSCEPMRYAVNRLEGAILRGLEHALAVNLGEPVDEEVSPMIANFGPSVFEFTEFGDWDLAVDGNAAFDLLSAIGLPQDSMLPGANLDGSLS